MKYHHRVSLHLGIVLKLSLFAIGCSSEPDLLPQGTVDVPDEFAQDGTTWKKQSEVHATDNDCLAKFFSLNQDLVGSPEFDGEPTVFTSGKNDRRFYWLIPAVNDVRWQCVEFRKGKFATRDGTTNPFE